MRLHPARAVGLLRAPWMPGWSKDPLWRRARAVPSLDLRFADSKSLVDATTGANLVTFTRASGATYVDSQGILQTASNDVPRFDHNPVTGESLGLLVEEQRVNLLLNSGTLATQNVTVTAVAHTLSFTGTGTITLSGTSTAGPLVGTGTGEANRVSLTFTPTAGTLTLTVSGTVTNAQLEIGSFRTSYIPTSGTAATRSADVASISGSNYSSWANSNEVTLYADVAGYMNDSLAGQRTIAAITDGTYNNNFAIGKSSAGKTWRADGFSGGGGVQAAFTGPYAAGVPSRIAFGYALNNANASFNGSVNATDTSVNPPVSPTRLEFRDPTGASAGHPTVTIKRFAFWPTRLNNSTLQEITR